MPYEEHRLFETPPGETRIWRYMSAMKLLQLASTSMLHFSRLDALKSEDPFEGEYSRPNTEAMDKEFAELYADGDVRPPLGVAPDMMRPWLSLLAQTMTFVNCWHMSEVESAAMWKIYASDQAGVAVVSTVDRLIAALAPTKRHVHIGRVQYVDYETHAMAAGNSMAPALT